MYRLQRDDTDLILGNGFAGLVPLLAPWQGASGTLAGEPACAWAAVSYAISFVYIRRFLSLPALDAWPG